eukprot:5648536-Ditylum_brightwellii.AAC.1
MTPIETFITSILSSISHTSDNENDLVVEYWSRDVHVNIDAHADIDEKFFLDKKQGGRIRCAEFGHVAYLAVEDGLRGPTVIFPGQKGGWRSSSSSSTTVENGEDVVVEMVTVPAVVGRVARFNGDAVHGVPKPPHRWLMSDVEEMMLRQKENDDARANDSGGDHLWWMDYDNDDDDEGVQKEESNVRTVLLFNTWKIAPLSVEPDFAASDYAKHAKLSSSSPILLCNDANMWERATIVQGDEIAAEAQTSSSTDCRHPPSHHGSKVQVCLMGNRERRQYPTSKVELLSQAEHRVVEV